MQPFFRTLLGCVAVQPEPQPQTRKQKLKRLALEGAVLGAALLAIGLWQTRGHLPGGPAPAFSLPSLAGPVVSTASLAGKPTLVAFWAPWCGVCRAESDNLSRVAKWMSGRAN